MYFKSAVLLICSAVVMVNLVVGPKVRKNMATENQLLDGYFRMILEKLKKPNTDTLTKEEFLRFVGVTASSDVNAIYFYDNNLILKACDDRIDRRLFRRLLRGISKYLPRWYKLGDKKYQMTPVAFANNAMIEWNNDTITV